MKKIVSLPSDSVFITACKQYRQTFGGYAATGATVPPTAAQDGWGLAARPAAANTPEASTATSAKTRLSLLKQIKIYNYGNIGFIRKSSSTAILHAAGGIGLYRIFAA
jgi:hypothetical protein